MEDQLTFDEKVKPALPTGLNVLTILTFVWCAYELFSTLKTFSSSSKALQEFDNAQEKMKDAPAWAKKFAGPEMREMLNQSLDNKIPILIISFISVSLCVFGAIEMRKLKKQGYFLWLIGEILPYLSMVLFASAFFSTFLVYFTIFPVLFIVLYSLQRKNLRY